MQKLLKALHVLGSAGVLGALLACLVLDARATTTDTAAAAVLRADIALLVRVLLVPSLGLALFSGLLSTAINSLYQEARWVWLKAGLGLAIFEATLFSVGAGARRAAELAAAAAAGQVVTVELAQVLRTQTRGLWMLGLVAVASVLLAVWRPRLRRSVVSAGDTT